MKQPLRRRARSHVLTGLAGAGELVPRRTFAALLRGAAFPFRYSRYAERVRSNLRTAFGDGMSSSEVEGLVAGVFRHGARQFAEWLRLSRSDPPGGPRGRWIHQAVQLDASNEILRELHAAGRGVIIATPHLGNWELLAARLRHAHFDGAVVGRKSGRDSSSDWLVAMRRAYGLRTIPQDASPRESLSVLRAGGVLGLLPDLEVRRLAGEHVPFFGVPALTMTAPAALARAHRVPILPARCTLPRDAAPNVPYTLRFDAPLELDASLDHAAARTDLTRRLNDVFEAWIRETPEQWAWHQHRWRTRPGEFDAIPLAERRRRERASR